MVKPLQDLRQSVRLIKNDLVNKYFNFRVDRVSDPYSVWLRSQPYKVLFILSHMRSGSSLLTHLLNNNPEIIGYGETHISYHSEADFKNLILKVYLRTLDFRKLEDVRNFRMNHQYVLDKVLHDHKFINDDILKSDKIHAIFLLREPERTLASILDQKTHWTEEKALDYYIHRLAALENYAKLINDQEKSLFIKHQQLLNSTDNVFQTLQTFLKTNEGFSEEYKVIKTTGQRGVGDYHGNIKAGQIVREARKLEIQLLPQSVTQSRESFERCCATLSEYCTTIDSE